MKKKVPSLLLAAFAASSSVFTGCGGQGTGNTTTIVATIAVGVSFQPLVGKTKGLQWDVRGDEQWSSGVLPITNEFTTGQPVTNRYWPGIDSGRVTMSTIPFDEHGKRLGYGEPTTMFMKHSETRIEIVIEALPPSCSNQEKDGRESDVDCGGADCPKCGTGQACTNNIDCFSDMCAPNGKCAAAPTCTDKVKNGTETDTDCGGGNCTACVDGKACKGNDDCQMKMCANSICGTVPTCTDGKQNNLETDLDCGGPACPKCADLKACAASSDCQSGVCTSGVCQAPKCGDGVKSGTEQCDNGAQNDCTGMSPCASNCTKPSSVMGTKAATSNEV